MSEPHGSRRSANLPACCVPFSTKGRHVRRFLAREPRYSRQEIEAQATKAIEERIGLGRPPEEEWRPLEARLAETELEAGTPFVPQAAVGSQRERVPATAQVQGP